MDDALGIEEPGNQFPDHHRACHHRKCVPAVYRNGEGYFQDHFMFRFGKYPRLFPGATNDLVHLYHP